MMTLRIFCTLPLLAACLLVAPAVMAVQTDCNDPEAEAGWSALLAKYPGDHDVRNLYRLRRNLCEQVEAGDLSLSEASNRFERARQRLVDKWRERNERRGMSSVGSG